MTGLRYFSFFGATGYAEAARRYLLGLAKLGFPVTWTPLIRGKGWPLEYELFEGCSVGDPDLDPFCNRPIEYDTVLLHTLPAYFPRLMEMVRGKRIAAYTVWETDRLPNGWAELLRDVELLLVPCEWNREIFKSGGFHSPIEVVPHSLLPSHAPLPSACDEPEAFTFYSINTWDDRKAVDRTLASYLEAFTAKDSVRFVLKTTNRHGSLRVPFTNWHPVQTKWLVKRLWSRYPDPPPLTMITDQLPNSAIQDLHRQGDCYVSLCHSEGWGIGAFDAAASGRPVIMTGFGGQTDFLPDDLAWLVRYRMVPTPFRPLRSHEFHHRWAEADTRHGSQLMRHVYENRLKARQKAATLACQLRERYRPEVVAQTLVAALGKHL